MPKKIPVYRQHRHEASPRLGGCAFGSGIVGNGGEGLRMKEDSIHNLFRTVIFLCYILFCMSIGINLIIQSEVIWAISLLLGFISATISLGYLIFMVNILKERKEDERS